MLFFIDESWQTAEDGSKVGVLAAVQIKARDFNECARQTYSLKVNHLGFNSGNVELKGNKSFREYLFRLEKKGIKSTELALAKDLLTYYKNSGAIAFGSIVFSKEELTLTCTDENHLERPFYFLFERINLFMQENHPGLMAKLIFDDRGAEDNAKISASVTNFLSKAPSGQSFDKIIKFPSFAISTNNAGLQIADLVAHILAKKSIRNTDIRPYWDIVKSMEFRSRKVAIVGEASYPYFGFKTIKDKKKEIGDLFDLGRV